MWLIKYANTRIDGSFGAKMAEDARGYWGFFFRFELVCNYSNAFDQWLIEGNF